MCLRDTHTHATGVTAAECYLRLPLGAKKMVHSIAVLAATAVAVSIASTDGVSVSVTTHARKVRRHHVAGAPLGFAPSPSRFTASRHTRRRGLPGDSTQLELSAQSSKESGREESRRGSGVAVHDDSWHLGDGGFAERHLEDEARIAAKKARLCSFTLLLQRC